MKQGRFVALAMLVTLLAAPDARACGCFDNRPWGEVASSDVLFLGRLVKSELVHTVEFAPWIQIRTDWSRPIEPTHAALVFQVERWWNGSGKHNARVLTDLSSCGLSHLDAGIDMLVEAWTYRGVSVTWMCARSIPIYPQILVDDLVYRSATDYEGLITRDSLVAYLGAGSDPSRRIAPWVILAVALSILSLLLWRGRKRAA